MIAVIRLRGEVKTKTDIEDTMLLMNLKAVNNCVVVPKNEAYRGMIQKVNDHVTWGEIDQAVFRKMLLKWGRAGKARLDEKYFKERKQDVDGFVGAFFTGRAKLRDLGINPVFRLHPPAKGYEGVKRPYSRGGSLGYRGKEINELLGRMI
jgi:large subunit ribosomal protein L30